MFLFYFTVVKIARVQCVSTVICKRVFLIQNCINTKHMNRELSKKMKNVLQVVLKWPIKSCHEISNEVIGI